METLQQTNNYPFLRGGGEMSELTHNFIWAETAAGSPENWPKSLQTTVSILLRSRFPMFLWWGDDLIQFYNDAYRPSLGATGKHPVALGQKGIDCWQEIWPVIYPLIQQVKDTGEATWMEDQLIPIYRNGKLEDVYWTFSYSLVLNDEGAAGGVLVTCMETTDAVLSRKKLEEANEHFRLSILQAPFAICIFKGPDFVIEIANEKMFEFWGKSSEEVMNKALFDAIPEAKNQGYEELMGNVLRTGEPFSASELPVMLPRNGEVQEVLINFSYRPLHERDGSISGIVATAMDVTEQVTARRRIEDLVSQRTKELGEANENLQVSNTELNRSNKYLEEFAHAASHDLKEPIRKISFFTSQLKELLGDRLTENESWSFGRIERATERMSRLIEDLLMYSHVSQQPIEPEQIDLNQKLRRVLEDLELDIAEKNAAITVGPLPTVRGYRRQLQQVFQNILSNALKYCKPGEPPVIHISADEVTEDEQIYHMISIKDNGIGFEQQYAEKIFQMFSRLHGRTEYSGSGVGLSIVKKVLENHKGFVRTESEPGEGSEFRVYLPV